MASRKEQPRKHLLKIEEQKRRKVYVASTGGIIPPVES